MKKLFFVLIVLLTTSVYSQSGDDFNNGIDFTGAGTEPFWSIKIDIEKGMFFSLAGDEMKIETGIPQISCTDEKKSEIYSGESETFYLKVKITGEACNDGMSDNQYPYSVKVTITRKGHKEIREFSGCGNYVCDSRLNDIWALIKFKGEDITKEKLQSRPYMEIHINDNKIIGNASCNEFFGAAFVKGDKIIIGDRITLTKMNCSEMKIEINFINAISGKTMQYKIEKMKLYLFENGKEIMEFNKMD